MISYADREAICRRHGIAEHIALDLHGETLEELEADAAARAAIASLFQPRTLGEVDPKRERDRALIEALHPELEDAGGEAA